MRTRIIETKLYSFGELSMDAQAKAIEAARNVAGEHFEPDCVYDDAATIGDCMGFDIRQRRVKYMNGTKGYAPSIYYSGFYSQGDGASFDADWRARNLTVGAVKEHAPQDAELHRIAGIIEDIAARYPDAFVKVSHSGHYYHSGCTSFDFKPGDSVDDEDTFIGPRVSDWIDAFPEEEFTQAARDFMNWIYETLKTEYEYVTGEESARECLNHSGEEFTEDGDRA